MKRKALRRLRLSPNEESQLIREELNRRRKIRIQQVREQARTTALHIRADVQRRRERELQLLAEELRQDWEFQQREKIQALQRLYEESLRLLGQGHRSAKENEPDWEAMAQQAEENQLKAKQRYREALKELTSQRHKDQEEHSRPANFRRKALQAERERAARVASLPLPPPHPIETIEANRSHAGRSDVSVFSATHHHCLEPTVDREVPATQPDAHEEAQQEARRLQEWRSEAERQREEQQEKARLRGRCALKREQLTQDRERLVVELEHMQQTELLRRRQQVAHMPAQIFQPLHRRREAREDGQRDMEFAFEDMYTGERRVKGDLVLKLVPEPLPALSTTSSQDQELDVTVDNDEDTPLEITPATEAGHHGNGQHSGPAAERVEPPKQAHRQALKKLLDRIRTQRDQGRDQAMEPIRTKRDQGRDHPQEPNLISSAVAHQLPVHPDEAPERDSSIDTGSLSVEEPGREASSPHPLPEPPSEEESVVAPLPPEVLSSRMQEWKKREEALEREKRQQMALLEELEEQKLQLEGMLLDAQRQREDMQAAVNQEVPLHEQEVPAHNQEVNSDTPSDASEDHSSRIRQHQQRLLEQNRIHQRSVEVARQRLEQYQRALRIRHSTAITPRPPTGPPAALAPHPPLNPSAKTSVHVATPPMLPRPTDRAAPPSALREIPTRESDVWTTPPPPHPAGPGPGSHIGTSLTRDPNRFPQDSPEDHANGPPPANRAGLSAWLTDSIMERATGHLPERLRSPSAAPNPFTHPPLGTTENVTTGVQQSSQPYTRPPHLGTDPVRLLGPAAPQPRQTLAKPLSFLRGHPLAQSSLPPRKGDVERQRWELLEAHRRMQEQREEQRHDEEQREQMRRQREALQALINTETQNPLVADPLATGEEEEVGRSRLRLLSSLLRAIEESHGGSLSHLEDHPQPASCTPPPHASDPAPLRIGVGEPSHFLVAAPPPRAQKPPPTRVKLGAMVTLPGQHELSAIQEVETPGECSLVGAGPEDVIGSQPLASVGAPGSWDRHQRPGALLTHIEERPAVCSPLPASERSTELSWRKRLLDHPPETGGSSRVVLLSWRPCDQGGGSSGSPGSISSGYTANSESAGRPAYPDSLSSSSLSTGSYITTDPDHNSAHTALSSAGSCSVEPSSVGDSQGPSSSMVPQTSPIPQTSLGPETSPGRAVAALFHESSIQRIIDKYTRELNASLCTSADTTGKGALKLHLTPSLTPPHLVRRLHYFWWTSFLVLFCQEWDNTVNQILEQFSESVSLVQDISFRPLIGQLADQSSGLAAEGRDSAVARLIGQPSAQSSMIGQLPGQSLRAGGNQGAWDSTLSRMIDRLSHQPSSLWSSGGRDFYSSQLMGRLGLEQTSVSLDEGQEESRMRPLIGQLDESGVQRPGSSGTERASSLGSVESVLVAPPPASQDPVQVPESPHHQPSAPLCPPHHPSSHQPIGFAAQDSFHPLLAQVTHNDSLEPSMTFHLPQQEVPSSPEGSHQFTGQEEAASTDPPLSPHQGEEDQDDSLVDPSPELPRAQKEEEVPISSSSCLDSFGQLNSSQNSSQPQSLLLESPEEVMVEEVGETDGCQQLVSVRDSTSREMTNWPGLTLKSDAPVWDKIIGAAWEKGILEQSEITLVSVSDESMLGPDATVTEDQDQQFDSTLLPEEDPPATQEQSPESHPGVVLEPQAGSGGGLQEAFQRKRLALIQRSALRVEEIRAKRALAKTQPSNTRGRPPQPSNTQGRPPQPSHTQGKRPQLSQTQSIQTQAKTKLIHSQTGPHLGQVRPEDHTRFKGQAPVSNAGTKRSEEVRMCTPSQRKLEGLEMHLRTQRLYGRLEEVKQQKEVRSRQESYAQNRLKAKEFHQKTLQKLRAKQTAQ
ncbi:unnamed protein product [Lota lota]